MGKNELFKWLKIRCLVFEIVVFQKVGNLLKKIAFPSDQFKLRLSLYKVT